MNDYARIHADNVGHEGVLLPKKIVSLSDCVCASRSNHVTGSNRVVDITKASDGSDSLLKCSDSLE